MKIRVELLQESSEMEHVPRYQNRVYIRSRYLEQALWRFEAVLVESSVWHDQNFVEEDGTVTAGFAYHLGIFSRG